MNWTWITDEGGVIALHLRDIATERLRSRLRASF
jgi:hypothetical protein